MAHHKTEHPSTADKVTVGCCNFQSTWGNKTANLRRIKEFIREAAGRGVNMLAFPELALTGYECDGSAGCGAQGMHKMLAETVPGPSTNEIAALAREFGMYVVLGMPERDSVQGAAIYISGAVIGPEGVLGAHRKFYLSTRGSTERLCFKGGAEADPSVPVFHTSLCTIGVTICAEFWKFPEIARIEALKGALIIFNIAAGKVPEDGSAPLHTRYTVGARATENMVFVASAHLTGKDREANYYGHSIIAGPDFQRRIKVFAEADFTEGLVVATLSLKDLRTQREKSPITDEWRKLAPRLILGEYERLGRDDANVSP